MIAVEENVERKPYVMPHVDVGQKVLYFRYGERDPKYTYVGYVIDRKTGTVKIKTVDGGLFGAVRHVDDPRNRESEEARKDNGAWDYTDDEKGERLFKEEVRSKLADLSKQVAGLIAQAAKKGKE